MKSGTLQIGKILYDPTTRALTYIDGSDARLRNKSRAVLVYLLKHPNRTVSKTDILDNVWSEVTVSDESLVQCIGDIRRLLGDGDRKLVETVPREGYRLNLEAPRPASRDRTRAALSVAVVAVVAAAWIFWPGQTTDLPVPETQAPEQEQERASTAPPGTDSTEAYLEVLQGRAAAGRFGLAESLVAERHFRRAIDLDPTYARAHAELGTLLAVRFENNWNLIAEADRQKALFYAERAVSLDPDLWLGHYALGRLNSLYSNFDSAEEHLRIAMALQPDNEDARAYFGVVQSFRGNNETSIAILEQAIATHPDPPYWYYLSLGNSLFNAGLYSEAEAALNRCLEIAEGSPYCLRYLLATLGMLGRLADAGAAGRVYEAQGFELSVNTIVGSMPFQHAETRAAIVRGLRRAGLPE